MTSRVRGGKTGVLELANQLTYTQAERDYAADVVRIVKPIVEGLGMALGARTEVVLHDLTKIPKTIVAISGNVTGRTVDGPPTDLGLRFLISPTEDHLIGYRSQTQDELELNSSSLFFRTETGRAVACLCLNTDIGDLEHAYETLRALIGKPAGPESNLTDRRASEPIETFPQSVDELGAGMLHRAIVGCGVPVNLMKKTHKIEIVEELQRGGFFAIREAVDFVAEALQVSRYTVYNYLNEIQDRVTEQGHQ